nr:PadR family transcriptional regulator [uncultured Sphingomonas sp.]
MRFHFHGRRHGRPDAMSFMQFGGRDWSFPWGNIHFEHGGGPIGRHGGGFGGPPRGRRRRMFNSEEFQLIILKLIADEPRHGYAIIKALEELTHGDYAPSAGILYTRLEWLDDMGLIERQGSTGAKKSFAITDEGRAMLEERAEEVKALFERLKASGDDRRQSSRPEIGRAIRNLMTALGNRAGKDGWNEDLLNEVVDIIDDAAKRIERAK